jgi:hypothetical protein
MKKIFSILLAFLWIIFPAVGTSAEPTPERACFGIALIGDPHLPVRELPTKESLLRTIDGWGGTTSIVSLSSETSARRREP